MKARRLILSISAANLLSLPVWANILYYSKSLPPPARNTYLGAVLMVCSFACVIFVAWSLLRRVPEPWPSRIAAASSFGIMVIVLNTLRRAYLPRLNLDALDRFGPSVKLTLLGVVGLVGVAVCLLAIVRRAWLLRRALGAGLIISVPFSVVTLGQSGFVYLNTAPVDVSASLAPRHASRPSSRVLLMIFDEADQRFIESVRAKVALPELDRIERESLYATSAYPPARDTVLSIPSLTTGRFIQKTEVSYYGTVKLWWSEATKPVPWSDAETLFSEARQMGYNTAVAGWYLSYCPNLHHVLTMCERAPFGGPFLGTVSVLRNPRASVLQSAVGSAMVTLHSIPLVERYLQRLYLATNEEHKETYEFVLANGIRFATDPLVGLGMIHWPIPHRPGIADESGAFVDRGGSYEGNILLVDRTLAKLREAMEIAGLWDRTIMLITSDHWLRTSGSPDRRVPFVVRFPGQEGVEYRQEFNNILLNAAIPAILAGKINSPRQLAAWLDNHRSSVPVFFSAEQ